MANPFALTLFGSPAVYIDDQRVTGFRSSKAQALLYYLVVTRRPHTRPTLAGLFWGDQPEDAARTSLSKCLSNLRDLVGGAILIDRQTAAFNRHQPYHLDTEGFLAGIAQPPTLETLATWQAALALYRGDFLEGFYVREAPDFEQWVLVQRAHYREAVLQGLHTLAHWHEQQGDLAQAISYTRRLLTLEPWHEEAHRQLMMLLARSGQRAAALVQFEVCQRILDEELAVEPAAETVALLEAIRSGKFDKVTGTQRVPENDKVNAMQDRHPVTLSPLHPVSSALPIPPTPLIGRERELGELAELIGNPQCRLITITGPGGVGKTRLALAAATNLATTFVQGAIFVPLAAISNPDLLATAILQALAQPLQPTVEPSSQLLGYLHTRQLLLVLDNYEQLLPNVTLLLDLLAHASGVKLLVTSRERLGLQAEQLFPLTGLDYALPDAIRRLTEPAATQLFLQRVRQLKPSFTPDAAARAHIAAICQISEGLPLALELAAGAIRTQPVSAIAMALAASQPLPSLHLRDRPTRHTSMQAVFAHSWRLLTPQEQRCLASLSVFGGGFTLAAAEQVAAATIEILAGLIDKSLLRSQTGDRFDLHELLRQFAAAQLQEQGEADQISWRHLRYYLSLAETLAQKMGDPPRTETLQEYDCEHANFRAALLWGFTAPAVFSPVARSVSWLTVHLVRFWELRHHEREGREWLHKALALQPTSATLSAAMDEQAQQEELALQAALHFCAGSLALEPNVAQPLLEQSLAEYLRLGDLRALVKNYYLLAATIMERGDNARAEALYIESLACARRLADPWLEANVLFRLASLFAEQGKLQQATAMAEESRDLFQRLQDQRGLVSAQITLAHCHLAQGNYALTSALLEEVHELTLRQNPQFKGGPWTFRVLGLSEQMQGHYTKATDYYRRSLVLRLEQEEMGGVAWALEGLVEVAAATGEPLRAAHLAGAAARLRQEIGSTISADDLVRYEPALATVQAALGEYRFQTAWTGGAALTVAQIMDYALANVDAVQTE
jgi:predicted ATPase/DNA-binding SARP family transcriptional activator